MDDKTDEELLKLVNMGSREVNRELVKRSYNRHQVLDKNKFDNIYAWEFYLGSYLGYVTLIRPDANINDTLKKIIIDENVVITHYPFYDGFEYYLFNVNILLYKEVLLDTLSFLIDRDIVSDKKYKTSLRVLVGIVERRLIRRSNIIDSIKDDIVFIEENNLIQKFMKENIRKYTLDQIIYQIVNTGGRKNMFFNPIILEGIVNYYGVSMGELRAKIQGTQMKYKQQILRWLDDAVLNQV